MSILTVENVTHGFGARQILNNASFRLLKGEHIGLVGANGEGKSTFLNIITGKLAPDEGKIEWCRRITTGYLDQYSTLEAGKTIYDVLKDAFVHLEELEQEMLALYDKMADCSRSPNTQMVWGWARSVWTGMLQSFRAVSVPRFCWQRYCWKTP